MVVDASSCLLSTSCPDYDLCSDCMKDESIHDKSHKFIALDVPSDKEKLKSLVRLSFSIRTQAHTVVLSCPSLSNLLDGSR